MNNTKSKSSSTNFEHLLTSCILCVHLVKLKVSMRLGRFWWNIARTKYINLIRSCLRREMFKTQTAFISSLSQTIGRKPHSDVPSGMRADRYKGGEGDLLRSFWYIFFKIPLRNFFHFIYFFTEYFQKILTPWFKSLNFMFKCQKGTRGLKKGPALP